MTIRPTPTNIQRVGRRPARRFDALVAAGIIIPAEEKGDPMEGWPVIRLAPGTVRDLIDEDRGDG